MSPLSTRMKKSIVMNLSKRSDEKNRLNGLGSTSGQNGEADAIFQLEILGPY